MKQTRFGVLALITLIGGSYGIARQLTAFWWPTVVGQLFCSTLPLSLSALLLYGALYRKYRYTREIPYFLFPVDFLLPLSIYPTLLVLLTLLGPRMALWQWGEVGTGTVQTLTQKESFDLDFGGLQQYQVDFSFESSNGLYTYTSTISGQLYHSLHPGAVVPVRFSPYSPRFVTVGDPELQARQAMVPLWGAFILYFWLLGAITASRRRYPPPAPPPYPAPQTAVALLRRYDLDSWLTEMDDAELWAAVVGAHFPMPEDEGMRAAGLRFAVGEWTPITRLQLQPTAATCFRRKDEHHLQRVLCTEDEKTDAEFDEALAPTVPQLLLYLNKARRSSEPRLTIVIPRPGAKSQRLPVYTAVWRNGNGYGETSFWERQPDGRWRHGGERINYWFEGA